MNRKRGAQLGNRNAFKHGFYSDQFKQAERINLSQVQNTDLTNEIELLRVQIRRYLEAETVALNQIDYETRLQALRTVSLATESLTRLIRTQVILNANPLELKIDQERTQPLDDIVD
ncbi:MAG: hypothetical protein HZB19_12595 [Chloroflexi bacterium]|nr:hypothetical protein [Chloroflexota bacterium]